MGKNGAKGHKTAHCANADMLIHKFICILLILHLVVFFKLGLQSKDCVFATDNLILPVVFMLFIFIWFNLPHLETGSCGLSASFVPLFYNIKLGKKTI